MLIYHLVHQPKNTCFIFFFIVQNRFILKKVPRVLYSTYKNKNLINQAVKQTFWMEIVFKVAPIKHVHLSVNYIGKCAPFAESFEICQIFLWHADVWWSETSNREHGNMQQSNKKKSGNKMFGALSVVASTIYFFIQNTPSWIVWWLFFRTPLLCKWHVPLLLSSFFCSFSWDQLRGEEQKSLVQLKRWLKYRPMPPW